MRRSGTPTITITNPADHTKIKTEQLLQFRVDNAQVVEGDSYIGIYTQYEDEDNEQEYCKVYAQKDVKLALVKGGKGSISVVLFDSNGNEICSSSVKVFVETAKFSYADYVTSRSESTSTHSETSNSIPKRSSPHYEKSGPTGPRRPHGYKGEKGCDGKNG